MPGPSDPWRVDALRAAGLAVLYAAIVVGVVLFAQAGPPFVYQGF